MEQNQNDPRRLRLSEEARGCLEKYLAAGFLEYCSGSFVPVRPPDPDPPPAPGDAVAPRKPVLVPLADGTQLDIALCDYDMRAGHFVRRPPPRHPPAPAPAGLSGILSSDLSSDLSSVALAKEEALASRRRPCDSMANEEALAKTEPPASEYFGPAAEAVAAAKARRPVENAVFWELPGPALPSGAAGPPAKRGESPGSLEQAFASALASAGGAHARPRELKPVAFLRNRPDGWTPDRQRRFLEELAECGIIKQAAARVGMTRRSATLLRQRAEGTAFAFAWEQAVRMGRKRLHSIAFERAVKGVSKPIFYHGQQVGEQRIYDHRLLVRLLGKAGDPYDLRLANAVDKKFDDWLDAVEHGWTSPQPRLEATLEDRVWQSEDGDWWTDFPPPDGAEVSVCGEYGEEDYCRALTQAEREAVEALKEREYDEECAERDRLFGPEK